MRPDGTVDAYGRTMTRHVSEPQLLAPPAGHLHRLGTPAQPPHRDDADQRPEREDAERERP